MLRLALAVLLLAAVVAACPKWVLYKQCDSKWGKYVCRPSCPLQGPTKLTQNNIDNTDVTTKQ